MRARCARQQGQALLLLVLLLLPIVGVALGAGVVARLVADQARLQAGVDAAAYSAAALQAEMLNQVAIANRTLAAHLATTAQVVSAVGHLRALARAARAAQSVGVVFPPLAPALAGAAQTADAGAAAAAALARLVVPLARGATAVEVTRTQLGLLTADAGLAARAEARLRAAAPAARLTVPAAAALRAAPLARAVEVGRRTELAAVGRGSLDPFSRGQRAAAPFGRSWQLARVGKDATTRIDDRGAVDATDRIGIALVRGKRFGAEVRVSGSEFGHAGAPRGWRLQGPEGPAPVRLEAALRSVAGRRLTARAAAAAVYRRPGRPDEPPDLFGPFWRPRLVPFTAEARR